MIDTQEIENAIKESIKVKVDNLVSEFDIKTLINRMVDTIVAEKASASIAAHISAIIKKGVLEKELSGKFDSEMKTCIEQEVKTRTANAIARIDIATEVGKHIDSYLETKVTAAALPKGLIHHQSIKWDGFKLSADALEGGTISDFMSSGIQDVADKTELTVADQVVVVENTLVSRNAEVQDTLTANDVVVNNIRIKNDLILNENINKQFSSMIKDGVEREMKERQIDIVENPILANGKELLTDNTLGSSVINSNIRRLGRLVDLNVSGPAKFSETLTVTDSGQIGINTNEPEGALTIWDDDSDLTIRRYKKKNMYVGTLRDTDLSLGVNGDVKLSLRKDGTVAMNVLELNGLRISVSREVPYEAGHPGEIVIMLDAKATEPWAYRCVGGAWTALR